MDYTRLVKNIQDVIKEDQVKLGFRSETIRLYYPLQSLNRLLKTELDDLQMQEELNGFCKIVKLNLGEVQVSHNKERFCFLIPPAGVNYVHEQTQESEFIVDFITMIQKHTCTIEEIRELFNRYSDHVHFERTIHGEFDYLIYFEDGVPDDFRYCITDEGCHLIYHRFTPEDYEDFHFSEEM